MSSDIEDKIKQLEFTVSQLTKMVDRLQLDNKSIREQAIDKMVAVATHAERNIDAIRRTVRCQTEALGILHTRLLKLEENNNVE